MCIETHATHPKIVDVEEDEWQKYFFDRQDEWQVATI